MAKPFHAVVISKQKNTITLLLSPINTEVTVGLDKLLPKEVDLGQKLLVLYDFTTMSVREVRTNLQRDAIWPEIVEDDTEDGGDEHFSMGDISLL